MNAGFSSLTALKANLLAKSLLTNTAYDQVITAIGLGMQGMLETFCSRRFQRAAGDQATFAADRASFLLPRYPVEGVTLVELQLDMADGFVAQDLATVQSFDPASGIVYMQAGADAGPYYATVRFTYTGGYWWDTSEDGSGVMPAGATELPDELQQAWLLQCQEAWAKRDKIGVNIADKPESKLSDLKMLPIVKEMVSDYKRMSLI